MTRRYEIVYIFDSAKEEPQIEEHLERFHALLKSKENPDPIRNVNQWGKRSLAYPIAGHEIGYYVVVLFSTDPTLLPEFERLVKLEEAVIRFQIVLNEGEVPVPAPLPDAGGGDRESKGDSHKSDEAKESKGDSRKSDEAKESKESSSKSDEETEETKE